MKYFLHSLCRYLVIRLFAATGDVKKNTMTGALEIEASYPGGKFKVVFLKGGIRWCYWDGTRFREKGFLVSECESIFGKLLTKVYKKYAKKSNKRLREAAFPKIKKEWASFDEYFKNIIKDK